MASSALKKDIEQIIFDSQIPWHDMGNAAIFITGATGLIGNVLISALASANEKYGLALRIIGHGRDTMKGKRLVEGGKLEQFIAGDIRDPLPLEKFPSSIDYVFHCASITSSADMVARPVDVITTAVDGTRNVLELAKKRNCRSFVYLSSMEIYGQSQQRELKEADLGYLDLENARTSYPESKRLCENLCISYASQYGLPVKIARLARTFGAGTPRDDSDMRVAAQFARKAIAGENIELHTEGDSIANCCDTVDVISGLLILLLKGENGKAYNIVNPEASMTVRQMAELVAGEVCGGKIDVIVKVPMEVKSLGYAPDVGFKLNGDRLQSLGWKPHYRLADMFQRMIADWIEEYKV